MYIVTALQQSNVYLKHVDSKAEETTVSATTKVTVMVKDYAHLRQVMANLNKVRSVHEVIRTIQ